MLTCQSKLVNTMIIIIPAKHQHVDLVGFNCEHVSIMTFAFSSKRHCVWAQPHRAASVAVDSQGAIFGWQTENGKTQATCYSVYVFAEALHVKELCEGEFRVTSMVTSLWNSRVNHSGAWQELLNKWRIDHDGLWWSHRCNAITVSLWNIYAPSWKTAKPKFSCHCNGKWVGF